MHAYTDSTSIAGDRDLMRARLREQGYLFFRRLVNPADVLAVREDLLGALSRNAWLDPTAPTTQGRPGPVVRIEGGDDYWGGYVGVQSQPSFHRLAHHPDLLAVLARLIADDLFVHPRKISRVSFPNGGFTTPPHQDFRYIHGTTDVFTVWIPLAACPPDLGGLKVLTGSQEKGLLPISEAVGAGGLTVDTDPGDVDWASIDYEPGDALVFHSLTVHGALPNTSDRLRLSVDYRYQSAAEPVTKATLLPHFYPTVPGWDELTAGWDSLASIAAPADLTLTEFGRPSGALALGPSQFVRIPGSVSPSA